MRNFLPQHVESVASRPLHRSSRSIMSAGASQRRTLMRPGAQHLSLSLVEHPSFKFRTYGAYASLATPVASTLTPIDDESGEDDDMVRFYPPAPRNAPRSTSQAHPLSINCGPRLNAAPRSALLSARAPPSAWKSGAGLFTPFTAMTAASVYSQDSWGEPEFSGPGVDADKDAALIVDPDGDMDVGLPTSNAGPSPLPTVRVNTRRFGMAFSPNAGFMLPLASASPANCTFVLNLQSLATEETQSPSSSSPEEHVSHVIPKVISEIPLGPATSPPALQNDKMADEPPQLPVATKEDKHDPPINAPRRTKSAKFTINRTSSAAKGLTRLLSCVSLSTQRTSGNKRETAKRPHSKKQTAHPVPAVPDLRGDESLIVLDLKTSAVDAMQMEASAGSIMIPGSGALTSPRCCQTAISPTAGGPEQISRHMHAQLLLSSMHLEDSHTLPAIAISPLEMTFGRSILP